MKHKAFSANKTRSYFTDCGVLVCCALLFNASAIIYYGTYYGLVHPQGIASLLLLLIIMLIIFRSWVTLRGPDALLQTVKSEWFRFASIAAIIAIALRIWNLSAPTYWDSSIYLYGLGEIRDFNFSIANFIDVADLAGHFCYGYSWLLAIGYFLIPDSTVGIGIVKLCLYLPCVYMIYWQLSQLFPDRSNLLILLATLIPTTAPMQLGTFSSINLDYPLMVFSIYLLFAISAKRPALIMISSLALAFSKETGVVIIAGIILGQAVYLLWHKRFKSLKLTDIADSGIRQTVLAVLIFIATFIVGQLFGNSWISEIEAASNPVPAFFGFSFSYIKYKLFTMFLFNGTWCYLLLILAGIVALIASRKPIFIYRDKAAALSLFFYCVGLCAYVLFSLINITFNIPRYCLASETALALLASIALLYISKVTGKKAAFTIIAAALITFSSIESVLTIDPVTKHFAIAVPAGRTENLYVPEKSNSFFDTGANNNPLMAITYNNGVCDELVYNAQSLHRDELIDRCLANSRYDENTDAIIWLSPYMQRVSCSIGGGTIVQKHGSYVGLDLVWSVDCNKRVFGKFAGETSTEIRTLNSTSFYDAVDDESLREKAVLIFDPLMARTKDGKNVTTNEEALAALDDITQELKRYYFVDEPTWISNSFGTEMCYVTMSKKDLSVYDESN